MDDEMMMVADDATCVGVDESLGLAGTGVDESLGLAGTGLEGWTDSDPFGNVEDDPQMNREDDDDSPWGSSCDDKCCRCNVSSGKGFY